MWDSQKKDILQGISGREEIAKQVNNIKNPRMTMLKFVEEIKGILKGT